MTTPITHLQATEFHMALAKILDQGDMAKLDQLRNVLDLSVTSITIKQEAKPSPSKLIDGKKIWADLQKINKGKTESNKVEVKGSGRWNQIAPDIKKSLARAGQAGAPGCRIDPDQKDRKKHSGWRPIDGFTQEEADFILKMAMKHGRGPKTIQQKWVWESTDDQVTPGR